MMRQFFEMKAKHPEALLLFRCGDFYETYCEDAIEASRVRSEEHTSELQSQTLISYAVFCLKKTQYISSEC